MERLYTQAQHYDMSLRAISRDLKTMKIHTDKLSYSIKQEMSFDSENELLTSTDHFIGGIASGILWSIIEYDKSSFNLLEEIEGKFVFKLQDPLVYINVKGYKGTPKITNIKAVFYCVTFAEEKDVKNLIRNAIGHSLIFNTIKENICFEWKIRIIY